VNTNYTANETTHDSAVNLAQDINELATLFEGVQLSSSVELFLLLSALSFIPFFMIAVTTFTRNIVVLSFLRHALGLQQSPPNIILITLALFLSIFTMSPIFSNSYNAGLKPYLEKQVDIGTGVAASWQPIKQFLITQTHESDIKLVYKLAKVDLPSNSAAVEPSYLIPAFMLSELKIAFKIGFIIFLPFLMIDIVIAAILMSLGMIMVPPITISLPIKIMLFVVVDGWALISETLIRSVGT